MEFASQLAIGALGRPTTQTQRRRQEVEVGEGHLTTFVGSDIMIGAMEDGDWHWLTGCAGAVVERDYPGPGPETRREADDTAVKKTESFSSKTASPE